MGIDLVADFAANAEAGLPPATMTETCVLPPRERNPPLPSCEAGASRSSGSQNAQSEFAARI
jgi:hypothetical protein